jgi:hypothetical protein
MHIMVIGYNLPLGESQGLTKEMAGFNRFFLCVGFRLWILLIEILR